MIIGTWNVQSLRGKEVELVEEVKKYKIDILGITETKKKGQGVEDLGSHKLIYSGVIGERARAGVALLVRNEVFEKLDFNVISERLLESNLEFEHKHIKIIVAYGPNEDASKEDKETFYNDLQQVVDNKRPNQEIMILGDLNARVGNKPEHCYGVIGKEGEAKTSVNGEMLTDFCVRNSLKISNTFFKHKDIHKWTRVKEERNEKSIIDYVIVSNSLFYNTEDVRVKRGAEIGSDHYLLIAKMNLSLKRNPLSRKQNTQTKLRVEKLKDIDTKTAYQNKLRSKLENEELLQSEDIEALWTRYKETLKQTANEICGRKKIGGPRKRTAWWNGGVKSKIKQKKLAWKKYLSTKSPEDKELYILKRNEAKEEVKRSKQNQWEKFGERLENNFIENQKLFWGAVKSCRRTKPSLVKHIKDKTGKIVKEETKILETWKDYFENLHRDDRHDDNSQSADTNEASNIIDNSTAEHEIGTNITMEELNKAKRKLKLGKAPGADDIYPEMVLNQGKEADKLLLTICQLAYKTNRVPKDWKRSTIVPIHKNGSTTQCENYRGISLLSVPGKVYARILEDRLRTKVESQLLDNQSGFRPGRSCQDHIFTLRQIAEKTHRFNKETHICFVDLQKAFDSVKREELWQALEDHDVDNKLIESIRAFYDGAESEVQILGKRSSTFKINVGVRQGCILSPLLFITLMNSISKQCKQMKPLNVGMLNLAPINISLLSFADDLVVFGRTQQELERNMNILNRELKKRGMTINSKKTKTMVLSRETKQHSIRLGKDTLEQVEVYKYLGVMIKSNGSQKEEINHRIGKANKVYSQLGNAFVNKRELTAKTKMSIFNSIYCPTLMYGSESWTLDSSDKSRLQAAEMKYLRRTVGKTKRDMIRNTRIREQVKAESLEHKIERNQLRWFGHVNRMTNDRIAKRVFECKQQDKLPRGRPRKMWEERIKELVTRREVTFKDAKRMCMDRDKWRRFLKS